jgi:hypothetical protein
MAAQAIGILLQAGCALAVVGVIARHLWLARRRSDGPAGSDAGAAEWWR